MVHTRSPFVVDVHNVLAEPGVRRPIRRSAVVAGLRAGLSTVPAAVTADLVAEAIEGAVHVRGTVTGAYSAECRRCLAPVGRSFQLEASEFYRPRSEIWEEGYVVDEETIDLEPLIRDNVLLGLPTSPLCRPDCAGLCSRCGSDLNEGPCDCGEELDPRWSALRELGRELG